jgi:hypothetical protein
MHRPWLWIFEACQTPSNLMHTCNFAYPATLHTLQLCIPCNFVYPATMWVHRSSLLSGLQPVLPLDASRCLHCSSVHETLLFFMNCVSCMSHGHSIWHCQPPVVHAASIPLLQEKMFVSYKQLPGIMH